MRYSFLRTLLLALLSLSKVSFSQDCSDQNQDSVTIVVDQSGQGQFTTVQQAIDSVPAENNIWTRIIVKPGTYKEKVVVPADKPCIVLEGNSASDTMIEWGDGGDVNKSATFTLYADNFKARNIGFKNTYNEMTQRGDLSSIKQAPAFQITTDKVSFYKCAFISVQDTLTDFRGRHYFESCYIEGAVDFIWGGGQSIYQGCEINATTDILNGLAGFITAQGRNSTTDASAYVFSQCSVKGTGPFYLGRAYRQYSRVVFHESYLSSDVEPEGWDSWDYAGQEGTITYAENQCNGPGADMSKRVEWEKTLSSEELYSFLSTFLLALLSLSKVSYSQVCSDQNQDSVTIVVDQSGQGQFTTVQQAIDSVPAENNIWTRIIVKPGTYKEKVVVPGDKPCIVLEGNSASDTMIEWGDAGDVNKSATFTLYADNFKARNIGFKNTYNEMTQRGDFSSIKPAPAFQITSDKVSFHQCAFISVQDTLTDFRGRHYFRSCYIEGAVDFIWGGGQSIYKGCKINATTDILAGSAGYITAQGRNSATDASGYIFHRCSVRGTGPVYLGRAYRQYSRVVFHQSYLSTDVVPEGWDSWRYAGQEGTITFAENKCNGPGADMSTRVKWQKTLSSEEVDRLIDAKTFINQDGWLQKQPF
ncbi:putative pectinesterase 10 [Syzygium oleosum]|uniref:putative pectinesterase 10 n=1 Tax=Syzygium oleosum TaxID=219896 RepID=UPI0011D20271|nr:putative pectinesterase 10 [Syzygium oleosum]